MAPTKKTTTTTTTTSTREEPATRSGSGSGGNGAHPRFNIWVALVVLSLVSLLAIIDVTNEQPTRDFQERWSLAMAAISMSIAFLACIGHAVFTLREKFVSSLIELVFAMIVVCVWIFALPMITTPDEGLSVDRNFRVDNANLYFASWGSFIFAMILLASVGNERGVSAARDSFARRWLWLVVSSLVVMAASSRYFGGVCQNNIYMRNGEFCNELKVGVTLSVVSAFVAGVMTLLLWFTPERIPIEMVGGYLCMCMLVLWGAMVAFLTFDYGPGATVGNIFFGVWISAIVTLDLFVCYATTRMN